MTVSVIREAGAKVLVLNRPAVGAVCLAVLIVTSWSVASPGPEMLPLS